MSDSDQSLRSHLVQQLDGRQAHVDMESVLARLSLDALSQKHPDSSHTIWELFEHIRIAQWDIVAFSHDPSHRSPEFPQGYWPSAAAPAAEADWDASREAFRHDLDTMKGLVQDTSNDLHAKIPHGSGQTLLREALLVADHNAYHLGQIVMLMKLMGHWS